MTAAAMWEELQRRWHPDDPERPTEELARYYQVKHDIVAQLHPRVIVEIGVRAGYSAFAMLTAAPGAAYIGFDLNAGTWGGQTGFTDHARTVTLAGFNARIRHVDSQSLVSLPECDLCHVDGDHSYNGALRDILLAYHAARFVMVDDYDFCIPVRAAANEVIVRYKPAEWWAVGDAGFRGNMILPGARHPGHTQRRMDADKVSEDR